MGLVQLEFEGFDRSPNHEHLRGCGCVCSLDEAKVFEEIFSYAEYAPFGSDRMFCWQLDAGGRSTEAYNREQRDMAAARRQRFYRR